MLPKRSFYNTQNKKNFRYINLKIGFILHEMKKNSGNNIKNVEVDPISGDYYVTIPEWIINELSWYEDTEINFTLDGKEVILKENAND